MDQPPANHDSINLRGGFAVAEWLAVGLGSVIAALGLGFITGSAVLGILIGLSLLGATWAVLLWI